MKISIFIDSIRSRIFYWEHQSEKNNGNLAQLGHTLIDFAEALSNQEFSKYKPALLKLFDRLKELNVFDRENTLFDLVDKKELQA